jgi:hypothetical protein
MEAHEEQGFEAPHEVAQDLGGAMAVPERENGDGNSTVEEPYAVIAVPDSEPTAEHEVEDGDDWYVPVQPAMDPLTDREPHRGEVEETGQGGAQAEQDVELPVFIRQTMPGAVCLAGLEGTVPAKVEYVVQRMGIAPGRPTLLLGASGSSKTMFVSHLVLRGAPNGTGAAFPLHVPWHWAGRTGATSGAGSA